MPKRKFRVWRRSCEQRSEGFRDSGGHANSQREANRGIHRKNRSATFKGDGMIQGLILHSVSYSGSWGQHFLALEDFIAKAADLGYDGVMLMAKRPHLS